MFLKKLSLIIFLLFVGTQVYSQTADEIFEKMSNALGKQYLNEIKTQKVEMEMSMMGMDMPMTIYTTTPDKHRVEMNFMGMNIITVVTPDDCFMVQNGNVMDMPGGQCEKAKENVEEQNMLSSFGKLKKNSKLELAGSEKVNNIDCYKIKMTEENGNEAYYYIGKNDYLLYKFTSKMNLGSGEQDIEMVVVEYKEINKIKMPSVMLMMAEGEEAGKITIKNVEVNLTIDESLYKRPK